MAKKTYHSRTPDLVEHLSKDIAAAFRLGQTVITITSVAGIDEDSTPRRVVRYYFESDEPDYATAPDFGRVGLSGVYEVGACSDAS